MKICYSTIGCPDWDFKEIFSCAKDLGYNAVEVRGISNELFAPAIILVGRPSKKATSTSYFPLIK